MAEWDSNVNLAPEGVVVETKVIDGKETRNAQKLMRRGNRWFLPDGNTHVIYVPTHWRGI